MGRKTHRVEHPQRSRLPANRELISALNKKPPLIYGIRRQMEFEAGRMLIDDFQKMVDDRTIPNNVVPRRSMHVTLMPRRSLDKQLQRGIVLGHKISKSQVWEDLREEYSSPIDVRLGDVDIYKKRYLGMAIDSPDLEEEYASVLDAMTELGLKGAFRNRTPLHVSLAEIALKTSRTERLGMVNELNDFLPIGRFVTLNGLDTYPANQKAA